MSNESTVIQHQDEVSVYVNEAGTITIRQSIPNDEDQIIAFHPRFTEALVRALRAAALDADEDEHQCYQRYSEMKKEWIAANPDASSEQYNAAITEIARRCGV